MTKQHFIELITAEQGRLRRFLCSLCNGDMYRADDIAQEALLKAYISFEKFEGRADFSTWLFRIALNCFYYDSKRKTIQLSDSQNLCDSDGDNTYNSDYAFEYQELYEALSDLSLDERTVILLFYMEDKSIKDISSIMNMPSGTVRSHLSRGRNHLRKFLDKKL